MMKARFITLVLASIIFSQHVKTEKNIMIESGGWRLKGILTYDSELKQQPIILLFHTMWGGNKSEFEQDEHDYKHLIQILTQEIIPTYYREPKKWLEIVKNSMWDVVPAFGSNRMADEYYKRLYSVEEKAGVLNGSVA